MAGLLAKIKADAQKVGSNKQKFFYVKDGEKRRIRFLNDMEDGFEIKMHDSYEASINVPCQELFGRTCQYCDEEGLRTRSFYAWSVWDYDANEVRIFMFAMNNCSPLGAIAAMYENYGTLLDRDYVVSVAGKSKDKTYSVVPMDKNKFRNAKAKPYSMREFLKLLDKAYPDEHADYLREDEEEDGESNTKQQKTSANKNKSGNSKNKLKAQGEEEREYSDMTARELYALCEEREIEAEPKMKAQYYIDLLTEYDEEHEEEGDIMNPPEDSTDYEEMTPKELYKLCQDREIDCIPKKPAKYYINLLKEYDAAQDDWGDSEEEDEDW